MDDRSVRQRQRYANDVEYRMKKRKRNQDYYERQVSSKPTEPQAHPVRTDEEYDLK